MDPEGNALTGADFTLEKKVGDNWVDVTTLSDGNINPTKTGSTSGSEFSFTGLGQGDYRLTETAIPEGYNEMSPNPVEFTVSATYSIQGDTASISALTGGTALELTSDTSAGSLTADIENQSGAELPTTGGMGTTIFYIVGAILVIGGGILLISKRRMHAE